MCVRCMASWWRTCRAEGEAYTIHWAGHGCLEHPIFRKPSALLACPHSPCIFRIAARALRGMLSHSSLRLFSCTGTPGRGICSSISSSSVRAFQLLEAVPHPQYRARPVKPVRPWVHRLRRCPMILPSRVHACQPFCVVAVFVNHFLLIEESHKRDA